MSNVPWLNVPLTQWIRSSVSINAFNSQHVWSLRMTLGFIVNQWWHSYWPNEKRNRKEENDGCFNCHQLLLRHNVLTHITANSISAFKQWMLAACEIAHDTYPDPNTQTKSVCNVITWCGRRLYKFAHRQECFYWNSLKFGKTKCELILVLMSRNCLKKWISLYTQVVKKNHLSNDGCNLLHVRYFSTHSVNWFCPFSYNRVCFVQQHFPNWSIITMNRWHTLKSQWTFDTFFN